MTQYQPRILIVPSAYKGSLTANQVAAAIAAGLIITAPDAQIKSMPLADGGDSTIEAIYTSLGGRIETASIMGPLGQPVTASWLVLDDTIIIEMAKCCGLAMVADQPLRPLEAHTFGLGQVISLSLLDKNKKLMIGVGGSASTDGGTAALAALGAKFLDSNSKLLPFGGGSLSQLKSIDISGLDSRLKQKHIQILTDVESPLLGPTGAAAIFAPQKGADSKQIEVLEAGLTQLANTVSDITGTDIRNLPGTGAAGGTAFGLCSLLGASIKPGFEAIAELIALRKEIENSDLIITAEGRLDHQSLSGKATGELAKICKKLNKPLWVFPASVQENIDWQSSGISAVYPTIQGQRQVESEDISKAVGQIAVKLIPVKS